MQRALSYWEREYGHQPSFVLNRFLSEICSNDELRMQRKEMLRQVLYEISILEKQQHLKVKDKKYPPHSLVFKLMKIIMRFFRCFMIL